MSEPRNNVCTNLMPPVGTVTTAVGRPVHSLSSAYPAMCLSIIFATWLGTSSVAVGLLSPSPAVARLVKGQPVHHQCPWNCCSWPTIWISDWVGVFYVSSRRGREANDLTGASPAWSSRPGSHCRLTTSGSTSAWFRWNVTIMLVAALAVALVASASDPTGCPCGRRSARPVSRHVRGRRDVSRPPAWQVSTQDPSPYLGRAPLARTSFPLKIVA
ncbi:hypothetical protein CALCODRAFT_77445 [Calocera cornea HHB12733]|uniref:Uncharacterized protein n=1 Tax=Calocera cornea HHB12733 TaxID=1353952 RepID=A0A165DGI5_9BASI|nr:hypothetical protein CALCODRAFT_77445 [Calocera cornea HHB12733]